MIDSLFQRLGPGGDWKCWFAKGLKNADAENEWSLNKMQTARAV